jgi:hypothetical protein
MSNSPLTDEEAKAIGKQMNKVLNSSEDQSISELDAANAELVVTGEKQPTATPELEAANKELEEANKELLEAGEDPEKKPAAEKRVADAQAKIKELTPEVGGRRRSRRRHAKKSAKKSKKGGARKSKKGGRSCKNGSKRRAQRKH